MALPCRTTGSLSPTFVSARFVDLAVKLPYAFALCGWFPISLREPLGASVTVRRRPPQSNYPPGMVLDPDYGPELELRCRQGGISPSAPPRPKPQVRSVPPILRRQHQNSM